MDGVKFLKGQKFKSCLDTKVVQEIEVNGKKINICHEETYCSSQGGSVLYRDKRYRMCTFVPSN